MRELAGGDGADVVLIPFAEIVSHRFRIADAALAVDTTLDPRTATKVLISDELA